MSLQWTIIATFLYTEIAIVLLLTLPIASPIQWKKLFESKFFTYLSSQVFIYFIVVIGVLLLCLMDAIRDIQVCLNIDQSEYHHLDAKLQDNMRLFRAQRNFYISGFALFLLVVIRQLIKMVTQLGTLLDQSEGNYFVANCDTLTVKTLLEQQGAGDEKKKKELDKMKSKMSLLEKELKKEKKDKEAMKSQAESVNKEYDRLAEEHSKLQKDLVGSGNGKKDT